MPIQLPGFVPSDYQQALDSVGYPPDTALRAQLALLMFTAKPHIFAHRCSTKETALMWAYTAFSVSQSW